MSGDGELQESARQWIFGPDDIAESFGFAYICEALDFHMEEMRKAIELQYEAQLRNSRKPLEDRASNPQQALPTAEEKKISKAYREAHEEYLASVDDHHTKKKKAA